MTKKEWTKTIRKACEEAKTYKPFFDSVIDTLAQILETRDDVHQQYIDNGSQPTIIKKTDRTQQENVYKNPMLVMENDLNSLALTYFRDLGLTAAGLKKLNVDIVNSEDTGSFEDLLNKISG